MDDSDAANRTRRTVEEWEGHLGHQLRRLRKDAGLTQAELARRADLGLSAVKGLEAGNGSHVTSLIKVLRMLGRIEWLEELAPPVPTATVSPMDQLRARARPPRADPPER